MWYLCGRRIDGLIIDYIVGGIYLEMLEKGLITSMMINKSNNWLAWFLDFDVNYSERKEDYSCT